MGTGQDAQGGHRGVIDWGIVIEPGFGRPQSTSDHRGDCTTTFLGPRTFPTLADCPCRSTIDKHYACNPGRLAGLQRLEGALLWGDERLDVTVSELSSTLQRPLNVDAWTCEHDVIRKSAGFDNLVALD